VHRGVAQATMIFALCPGLAEIIGAGNHEQEQRAAAGINMPAGVSNRFSQIIYETFKFTFFVFNLLHIILILGRVVHIQILAPNNTQFGL
jgi:hypothetical protein